MYVLDKESKVVEADEAYTLKLENARLRAENERLNNILNAIFKESSKNINISA